MNLLIKYLQQLKSTFLGLSTPQKILSAGSVLIFLGSLSYLLYSINKTEYDPLYSGLSQQDAAAVVQTLKVKKIPYRLSDTGTVSVPRGDLHEVRLALATEGLPKGPGVGFEIFDQQKLGSSEFVQKINYQRAMQGELARTIDTMDEVLESRVHLVIPEESLFVEEQKTPSASVVLKLRPGAGLEARQAQGIVRLVSGAVQGMREEDVTILSTDGRVIYKKDSADAPFQMTNLQMDYKTRLEEDLHRKVQSMLEQVLGANRVITRVTVDLDFNQSQVTEDTYDPDSTVVRSQQRSIENSEGKEPGPRGNPDVPINVESKLLHNEPQESSGDDDRKSFNRQRETVNYEINRVSRQIVRAPGSVKKLSVAVIVDGNYQMKPDKDGRMTPVFVGRSAQELKSVEEIVKKAVGYDDARGDQIAVSNTPFATDLADLEGVTAENKWLAFVGNNQKILLNLLLTAIIFLFVIRPFMRKFQEMTGKPEALPGSAPALPGAGEALTALPSMVQAELKPSLRKDVALLVQRDPDRATDIIRAWLREEN